MTRRWRGLELTGIFLSLLLLASWNQGEAKNPPIKNFNSPRLVESPELKDLINQDPDGPVDSGEPLSPDPAA